MAKAYPLIVFEFVDILAETQLEAGSHKILLRAERQGLHAIIDQTQVFGQNGCCMTEQHFFNAAICDHNAGRVGSGDAKPARRYDTTFAEHEPKKSRIDSRCHVFFINTFR